MINYRGMFTFVLQKESYVDSGDIDLDSRQLRSTGLCLIYLHTFEASI